MATRTSIASDNFNRGTGLGANWTQLNSDWGSITISASTVFLSSATNTNNESAARWAGSGSFTDDQYSEVTIGGLTFLSVDYNIGVICRASGDLNGARDFYFACVAADSGGPNYTTTLGKVVNGTRTVIHSTTVAWSNGDKISLEAEGTTLRLCKNGTALGGSFTATGQTDLTTGLPGVLAGASASFTGDDWVGGNLGAGTTNTNLISGNLNNSKLLRGLKG